VSCANCAMVGRGVAAGGVSFRLECCCRGGAFFSVPNADAALRRVPQCSQCLVACGIYVVTLLYSVWQFKLGQRKAARATTYTASPDQ